MIDGFHRAQIDKEWPRQVLWHIDTPGKLEIARLLINVVRRKVSAEEKTKSLANIAKLTGWTPQEIAEATGMSYRCVTKYLPDGFKMKPQTDR